MKHKRLYDNHSAATELNRDWALSKENECNGYVAEAGIDTFDIYARRDNWIISYKYTNKSFRELVQKELTSKGLWKA